MIAHVNVRHGFAEVCGNTAIPGVPGTGSEILMNWAGAIGAHTGKLLPTGAATDVITLADGRTIDATLRDVGNLIVWVTASSLGSHGTELPRCRGQ